MRWPHFSRHPRTRYCIQRCQQELRWLAHQLLPPHCPLCNKPLQYTAESTTTLCDTCTSRCQQRSAGHCPSCDEPYTSQSCIEHLCSQCQTTLPPFEWIKTAGVYTDEMAQAMNGFKYHGQILLAKPLAQCIIDQLGTDIKNYHPDIIIPVPLHRQRLRERGYNQSLLLAQHVGNKLGIKVESQAISRNRPTQPNSLLSAQQRRKNLNGAFKIERQLTPKRILLIDDIVTTTSTARSCSNLLSKNGHRVAVAALGRASLK